MSKDNTQALALPTGNPNFTDMKTWLAKSVKETNKVAKTNDPDLTDDADKTTDADKTNDKDKMSDTNITNNVVKKKVLDPYDKLIQNAYYCLIHSKNEVTSANLLVAIQTYFNHAGILHNAEVIRSSTERAINEYEDPTTASTKLSALKSLEPLESLGKSRIERIVQAATYLEAELNPNTARNKRKSSTVSDDDQTIPSSAAPKSKKPKQTRKVSSTMSTNAQALQSAPALVSNKPKGSTKSTKSSKTTSVPKSSKGQSLEVQFEDGVYTDSQGNTVKGLRRIQKVKIDAKPAGKTSHKPTAAEREQIYPGSMQKQAKLDSTDSDTDSDDDDQAVHDLVEKHLGISLSDSADTSFPDTEPESKGATKDISTNARLDHDAVPVSDINDIFQIIARKLLDGGLFMEACAAFEDCGLRVFTMCSGTESPLLALQLLGAALAQQGMPNFPIKHLASAEIVPFKQAYIQRNFNPAVLFRDVTEFAEKDNDPHTAYGGTAPQPKDVHILVAGSSCVDYSTLNSKPKQFGQKGQSYDTLQGIRSYADNYRPAIVILENVKGAPWPKIRKFFEEIDYYGVVFAVDTKDFYLPQTRQRGYMVAFDQLRAAAIGMDLEDAAKTLAHTLNDLAQRASSPYTDFIFADDDPELQASERIFSKLERNAAADAKIIDWSKCRIRYSEFRTTYKLGVKRPLTLWRNNGKCTYPDYAWTSWGALQRERILDTLDINHLYFVGLRDFDGTFKSKMLDLSQNVDRNEDTISWGLTSCITPSGMPFDTRRGGPVFGKEILALQGIPAQTLSLNKENSSQLQDLAGNAMTTTVVGAVIAAAIVASRKRDPVKSTKNKADDDAMVLDPKSMFQEVDAVPTSQERSVLTVPRSAAMSIKQLVRASKYTVALRNVSLHLHAKSISPTVLSIRARRSIQLCRCEGVTSAKPTAFRICTACGHTACSSCFGNPKHQYMGAPLDHRRIDASSMIDFINDSLPPLLTMTVSSGRDNILVNGLVAQLINFDEHNYRSRDVQAHKKKKNQPIAYQICTEDKAKYSEAVINALKSTVYLQSIKHERTWRILYTSASALLELCLAPQHDHQESSKGFKSVPNFACTWNLYALPPRAEPAQSWLRDTLARPIARLKPIEKSIFKGDWELWSPSMPVIGLNFQGEVETNSWEKTLGLRDDRYRDLMVFSKLHISTNDGSTKQVSSSMASGIQREICGVYQLEQECGAANGSLYRKENSADDKVSMFFFLDPKNIGNAALDRFVFAKGHERLPLGVNRPVVAEMERAWRPSTRNVTSTKQATFTCRLVDRWTSNDDIAFASGKKIASPDIWIPNTPSDIVAPSSDCTTSSVLVVAKLPALEWSPMSQWKQGYSYPINLIDRAGALQEYQWLLRKFPTILSSGKHTIELDHVPEECACTPQMPELQWLISRRVNSKQMIVKPFESNESATKHELELKQRPSPVVANVHWYGTDGCLTIHVNVATLVHRVSHHLTAIQGSRIDWCLTKTPSIEMAPKFPKLTINEQSETAIWPEGDPIYGLQPHIEKPVKFISRHMWKSQRQTLAWMRRMERGSPNWNEWAFEDVNLPALGLSLQVEAFLPAVVKGGVVADDVGAGKTTTSLALIARGLEDVIAPDPATWTLPSGRIRSKASLILVPTNLIPQWKKEVAECFGKNGVELVVISKFQDLQGLSIQALRDADIVLAPWNMFEDSRYWSSMRDLCWIANVPTVPGRGFEQWLENAVEDLQELATGSNGCTDVRAFWKHRRDHAAMKQDKYSRFQAFREVSGKTPAAHKDAISKTQDPTKGQASYPVSAENLTVRVDATFDDLKTYQKKQRNHIAPLLHFFGFQRLIVDEFTYLEAKSLLAILKLEAECRWILSGTPPLTTFDNVNTIAKLLGTKITLENEKEGIFTFAKAKVNMKNDKSYAEEFREQTQMRSSAWLHKRNEKACTFTETFICKRSAPSAVVRRKDHYIGIKMSVAESVLTLKAYHRLMRQTIKFQSTQKVPVQSVSDAKSLFNALEQAPNAEAALLCCTADLLGQWVGNRVVTDGELCQEMVTTKETQIKALLDEIYPALQEAFFLWDFEDLKNSSEVPPHAPTKLTQLGTYLNGITDSVYGDMFVRKIMTDLVIIARKTIHAPVVLLSKGKGSRGVKDGRKDMSPFDAAAIHDIKARRKELKERAADLNDMTREFTEHVQQARLLRGIDEIVAEDREYMRCSCCKVVMPLKHLRILSLCGHFSCETCLDDSPAILEDNPVGCVVLGCAAPAAESSVPANFFAGRASDKVSKYGTKMAAVVSKIETIQRSSAAEMIIIFVQFEAIRRQLVGALQARSIDYRDACTNAERVINLLKEEPKKSASAPLPPVLLLKVDSADAAGWNLQEYNHVMFVSPLQTKTRYDYEATMTQAVGRAFRFGQKLDVHVYHFVWYNSAEVNILQKATGRRLVRRGGDECVLVDKKGAEDEEDLCGPSLAGVGAFGGGVDFEAAKGGEEEEDDGWEEAEEEDSESESELEEEEEGEEAEEDDDTEEE